MSNFFKKYYLWFSLILITLSRLPSFFEGFWYGDENIYLALAHGMANGQWLYLEVWDNKPPMIYLVYYFVYFFFGTNMWAYRLLNLVFSIIALYYFDLICNKILNFSKRQNIFATSIFAFFLSFGIETTILNAENIFLPFVVAGTYYLFCNKNNSQLFLAGLLFSFASLTKIHALIEVIVLVLVWVVYNYKKLKNQTQHTPTDLKNIELENKQISYTEKISGSIIIKKSFFLSIAFLLPWLVLIYIYFSINQLSMLQFSLYGFSSNYLSANKALILGLELPFASLYMRAILTFLSLVILTYLYYKNKLSFTLYLSFAWLIVNIFGSLISERNYPHYLIPLFVPFSLVVSYFCIRGLQNKFKYSLVLLISLQLFLVNFGNNKQIPNYIPYYYSNFGKMVFGQMTLEEYRKAYFSNTNYIRQKTLVKAIQELTKEEDKIYLVSNNPEIYPLANRKTGYRHVTDYQYDEEVRIVYKKLLDNNTKLIMVAQESPLKKYFLKYLGKDYKLQESYSVDGVDFYLIAKPQTTVHIIT